MYSESDLLLRYKNKIGYCDPNAFEKFFESIMRYSDPDFRNPKPYGCIGDMGNDGYINSKGAYYQVYSPENITKAATIHNGRCKLHQDTTKLIQNWSNVKEICFVVNDKYLGIPPQIYQVINQLSAEYSGIHFSITDARALEYIFSNLSYEQRVAVLELESEIITSNSFGPGFKEIVDAIPPIAHTENAFHFAYSRYGNQLFGRENEFSLLHDFLGKEGDCKLGYWIITGPAGVGKSKLAYSLSLGNNVWEFRFLTKETLIRIGKLNNWDYPKDLCLIIDYANESDEILHNWFERLFLPTQEKRIHKLRILLLSREGTRPSNSYEKNQPEWYKNIIYQADYVEKYLYDRNFLELKGLSDKAYKAIIKSYAMAVSGESLPDNKLNLAMNFIFDNLADDDYLVRPIYVLFTVDACIHGKDPNRWNLEYLQKNLYDRNLRKWESSIGNHDLFLSLKNLLIYTTMIKEWPIYDTLPAPLNVDSTRLLNIIEDQGDDIVRSYLMILTGKANRHRGNIIFSGLVPDLVGEYFVLSQLCSFSKETSESWFDLILAELEQCKDFLLRAIQDFGDNPNFSYRFLNMFEYFLSSGNMNETDHEILCNLLNHYRETFHGSKDPDVYKYLNEFLLKYSEQYWDKKVCWAELLALKLYANYKHISTNSLKIFYKIACTLYEHWPDSIPVSQTYLVYLGETIDMHIGTNYLNYEEGINNLDSFIQRTDYREIVQQSMNCLTLALKRLMLPMEPILNLYIVVIKIMLRK